MTSAKKVVLVQRPDGAPKESDFELKDSETPPLEDGQVLLKVEHLSIDAFIRTMLDNRDSHDHKQISYLWPDSSQRFSRLFALGIDAYRMIPSLRRLMINPTESIKHNTGLLSVDKTGRVRRSLLMATYEKGRTRLLEIPETLNPTPGLSP